MAARSGLFDCALFDLSDRAKFRARGNDRIRFFNGQLTNDVRKATDSAAVEAVVLNAKGKIDAHVFVHVEADSFLVDTEPDVRQSLPARLERYIIADDVAIEDVTDEFSIFHVVTSKPPQIMAKYKTIAALRFGEPGFDVWAEASLHDELSGQLSTQFTFCDPDRAEILRIELGIPKWGRELTSEVIPLEANLERNCVDYEKGCYIGQETISRMKMSGQRSKSLCGLLSLNGSPLSPGMRLIVPDDKRREVGWITSATRSERMAREIALGYVKRGFNAVGSKFEAGLPAESINTVPVEVVDLPFVKRPGGSDS
jgi:tRNA-modifying protein YgfZ